MKIFCGYFLEVPGRGVSNEYSHVFVERKNISIPLVSGAMPLIGKQESSLTMLQGLGLQICIKFHSDICIVDK